jgi:ribosomal protein L7Ae-like RNA K-turn-binding protein
LTEPEAGAPGERRLLEMLGLAARARKLVAGLAAVRQGVRAEEIVLVLTARDAAPTQLAKLVPLLEARKVRNHSVSTRAALGAAVGRAPVAAVGLTDAQLARAVGNLVGAVARHENETGVE